MVSQALVPSSLPTHSGSIKDCIRVISQWPGHAICEDIQPRTHHTYKPLTVVVAAVGLSLPCRLTWVSYCRGATSITGFWTPKAVMKMLTTTMMKTSPVARLLRKSSLACLAGLLRSYLTVGERGDAGQRSLAWMEVSRER